MESDIKKGVMLMNLKKTVLIFFVVICAMSNMQVPLWAEQPLNMVVMGDSISKGVGSTDEKSRSFAALLAEKTNSNLTNLGITGLDSGQLLKKLETDKFQKAVKDADVIYISIGSNDLLKPFLAIISDSIDADPNVNKNQIYQAIQNRLLELSKKNVLQSAYILSGVVKSLTDNKKLYQSCEQFTNNFQEIVSEIKEINPHVVLYINNIYNPYYGVAYDLKGVSILNVYQLCEGYIQKLNMAFDKSSSEYRLLDMYSVFRQEGYTNVNKGSLNDMSKVNYDPHPNDDGYRMMADYIYTQTDSLPPTAELLTQIENMSIDGENLQIQFSEEVRGVSGKKLFLKSERKEYTYVITEELTITQGENGSYTLVLSPEEWKVGNDSKLEYDTKYEVYTQPGTFKDKGNNSLKEERLGSFHTEANPEELVQTMGHAKKIFSSEEPTAFYIIAVIVIGGIAVVIPFLVLRRKRRKTEHHKE